MKLPVSLQDQGISQDMVTTLSEIAAFRRNEHPQSPSSRKPRSSTTDTADKSSEPRKNTDPR